jgi:hypothetical protein
LDLLLEILEKRAVLAQITIPTKHDLVERLFDLIFRHIELFAQDRAHIAAAESVLFHSTPAGLWDVKVRKYATRDALDGTYLVQIFVVLKQQIAKVPLEISGTHAALILLPVNLDPWRHSTYEVPHTFVLERTSHVNSPKLGRTPLQVVFGHVATVLLQLLLIM